MNPKIVVAGTGTDVGKTIFAAALTRALDGYYWKPIQAGLAGETDAQTVARLSELSSDRILPEIYRLNTPVSPHMAAEIDGVAIDPRRLNPPNPQGALLIENAGGLAVPLSRSLLQIDLVAGWRLPVILCAPTVLGTINHSLLSIEAMKRRAIPILGIAFIGDENIESQRTIATMGGVKHLGRLPNLDPLNPHTLHTAFAENFKIGDLLGLGTSGP